MKYLILISSLFAITVAQHAAGHGESDVHGEADIHKKCQSDPAIQIDDSIFEKLKNNEKVDLPANFAKHMECMAKGMNMITADGKVNKDGIKTHVEHIFKDSHTVDEIVGKCAVDKETTEKTVAHIQKCLRKHHVLGGQHHGHHNHNSSESGSSESDEHHSHQHGHH